MGLLDLLLVTFKNSLNIFFQAGRERLKLVVLIHFRHTFGSSENKCDKLCLFTKEAFDKVSFKIHFSLLLVEEDSARALDIVICVAYFSYNKIEEYDGHGEHVYKPEGPNNKRCKHTNRGVILILPLVNLDGRYVPYGLSEYYYEHLKGRSHVFILFTLHVSIHHEVDHRENVYIYHKNGHEWV